MLKRCRSAAQKAVTDSFKASRANNTHPTWCADDVEDDSPWDSDPESGQSGSFSPNCRHCPALHSASTCLSNEGALLGDLPKRLNTELSAAHKKMSRLEAKKIHLQTTLDKLESRYFALSGETSFLENQLSSTRNTYNSQSVIWQQQVSEAEGRARGHYTTVNNLRRQVERATASAAEFKRSYKLICEWTCREGGFFSPGAQKIFRLFVWAGCAEAKVGHAIQALLDKVGVCVRHLPTVQHTIKEDGEFGLIQLGYEMLQATCELVFDVKIPINLLGQV
jgi:hypothetical protein